MAYRVGSIVRMYLYSAWTVGCVYLWHGVPGDFRPAAVATMISCGFVIGEGLANHVRGKVHVAKIVALVVVVALVAARSLWFLRG